ncbi:hypothetical protein Avbf_01657 [Armadillidium vulgare]|nr:hypothetical protein Avbf_01657 [Armadillidium vulgare]
MVIILRRKYASYRKSVILKKCDKLMSSLLIETNLEQNTNPRINSGICSRNNFNIVNAKRPLTSTKYGESYGHPKFSSAEEENTSDDEEIVPEKGSVTISNFSLPKEGKETRSTLGAPSKIQSSNSFGQNELCYQLACPLPKSVPLEVSARKVTKTPKYDRIVVLGNTHYNYYLEQLKGPKVCVMSDNISTENLLAYIERKKVLMPLKTLWVLVTGIDFLFRSLPYKSCTDFNCIYPLRFNTTS